MPGPLPSTRRAGPSRWSALLAAAVVLLALAGAALGWWLTRGTQAESRAQMVDRTGQRALQLADAMNGQVTTLVAALDVTLQELRRAWLNDPRGFDLVAREILAALPAGAVSHVTVVDAAGDTVYDSLGNGSRVNVADRDHFRVHLGGTDRLYVGEAVRSRPAGDRWTVFVSRPLLQKGRFAGTINVSVNADFLSARLAALALADQDVVALIHPGGRMIARSRDQALAVGRQLPAERPFLQQPALERGLFRVSGEVDGVARIYGWRRDAATGLVSAVGLAEADALAPLVTRQEGERRVLQALTTLVLLAAGAVLMLQWQAVRRQRALEQSEHRYRMLLDAAPDAIFVSRDDRFTYLNPAALRLFGAQDAQQLLGQPTLDRVHPDDRDAVLERRRLLVPGGGSLVPRFGRYLRLDGTPLDVEATASPFVDDDALCTQVIVRDVSERRAAERALQQLADELERRVAERTAALSAARDEAEAANRAKSEFLSRMSHELRTPLNAILGFGQLLELDPALTDGGRERVQEILLAGRHLLQLINDVLDLSRIEGGRLEISLEDVALDPLLHETARLVQPQAQARGIALAPPAGDAAAVVRADRTRLRQVLLNLLSNAVKYNRPGGAVRLRLRAAGDGWRIEVEDDGPGLDAAQRTRLFRPFERLDAARRGIEGTGIGLALSRHLVEGMAGRIDVQSEPGQGSCFWVELPAGNAPAPGPQPAAVAAAEAEAGAPARAPDRTVLQIEDNPQNRALVQGIVALRPRWRLLSAAHPAEGLALAEADPPDLVLLDLHLPDLDGFEVLRRLRASPRTCAVPVVAVSANAMAADLARGRDAGFDDYLTKPLAIDRLLAVLDARA